jgi:hypothetical protein
MSPQKEGSSFGRTRYANAQKYSTSNKRIFDLLRM